jgi:hypothetical protein
LESVCCPETMFLAMQKFAAFLALIVFLSRDANGQPVKETLRREKKKGIFYLGVGSHRIFFTPSTIHVIRKSDPLFDFALAKVKAGDDGGLRFDEMPQYSYVIGYYFKRRRFGVEYQFDHIKYFVQQNQVVHLEGNISDKQYDQDTVLNADFFQLEHSDGGNYAMINLVKCIPLCSPQNKIIPELMIKGGAGLVVPKTNSSILGNHRDDRYHVSGYIIGLESGFRFRILQYLFVSVSFKGAFANYDHFLIAGGYGKQKWFSGQVNYLIGGQFPL